MEKRKRVLELRDRLDRTLALPDLAEESSLRALVKKQMQASSLTGSDEGDIDLIAETRAKEVSEFLQMLNTSSDGRSSKVHEAPQKEWKVKQDTDQLRVMYREGPEGTPFHTLLLEGFADGPIDVCTCVSWESALYKKWFPQYNLPTFRIDQSGCLKKVRIGEEICLVRVKVPWPVSEREALLHYFELEYLKEDLVIVIMKTISDLDTINIRTHGFSRDGIPEAGDTVRIDVFGGFVLQRITKERSFFRAIANMDIKLDFVPPWFINFISRQLIGSGHKLYQKAVSTVATCDEDYKRALRGPLYVRIREYQDSDDKVKVTTKEENATEVLPDNPIVQNRLAVTNTTSNSEIVEEESEQNTSLKMDILPTSPSYQPAERAQQVENKPFISPEVEHALGILDTAIAVIRGDKTTNITTLQNLLSNDAASKGSTVSSRSSRANIRNADNLLNGGPATTQPQDSREIRQAYSLPSEKVSDRAEDAIDKGSLKNSTASTVTRTMSMTLRSAIRVHGEESLDTNGFHQNGLGNNRESKQARKTKRWPCCLTPATIG
ncbi:hypothetical protein SETIT_8G156900v2 [Setaria italica]|uniref:START domain-containing protein n=2 Tax=Setaria italica TaxID=4555 RepID=K3ZHY2_SETIT|nr:uncharacterized protein LOC101774426 isoform X1 [Setaria italica]RCV38612.1 hypothetical protein SETIT_8G156900v2 [Setaria italica]RCV38613.1 hypothetical protein SETIT_8G156900v2 [Setaria italica]